MTIDLFKEQTASCSMYRASSSYSGLAADICMSSVNRLQDKGGATSNSCSSSRRCLLQERLEFVEREVEAYLESARSENARLNRESYLWTAEDRIEFQETRSSNAERLDELLQERSDLQRALGPRAMSSKLMTGTSSPRETFMSNFKEAILRAMPRALFLVGYAAIFLAAAHLYVSVMSGGRQ